MHYTGSADPPLVSGLGDQRRPTLEVLYSLFLHNKGLSLSWKIIVSETSRTYSRMPSVGEIGVLALLGGMVGLWGLWAGKGQVPRLDWLVVDSDTICGKAKGVYWGILSLGSSKAKNPRGCSPKGFWPWNLSRDNIHQDTLKAFPHITIIS